MTGDIQLSIEFHETLIKSFGSISIAAAFIRIPYSTVGGWLRKGRWPATNKNFSTNYKPMYNNQQPNESDRSQPSAKELKTLHSQKLPASLQQLREQACLYALGGAIHYGIPS